VSDERETSEETQAELDEIACSRGRARQGRRRRRVHRLGAGADLRR
jgi:hypothetical protein